MSLQQGELLGPYRVDGRLGAGGTIAFADPVPLRRLTWVDRLGHVEGHVGDPADYIGPYLSP